MGAETKNIHRLFWGKDIIFKIMDNYGYSIIINMFLMFDVAKII
jgi:hypothetical protein